jgi:amidase
MANPFDGANTILLVVGPLTTSVDGLKLLIQAVLSTQPWPNDPLVHEIPWRGEMEKFDRLDFGIIHNNGVVNPNPPVSCSELGRRPGFTNTSRQSRRAVNLVVEAMQRLGHGIVEWKPTVTHKGISDVIVKTCFFDGTNTELLHIITPKFPCQMISR